MPDVRWPINGNRLHTPSSQLLVDLLTDSHLHQLVTQPTRYRSNQQPSVLDLVITSDDSSIANLEYFNPIGKSDHVTLMADLQLCHTPRARTVLFQRTIIDFEALNKRLTQIDWKSLLSDVSVSRNWDHFKTALSDAVSQSTSTSLLKKSSSKPWINGRILGQVRKKRSLWRAFKRSGSATDYEAHRAFSNHLSSVIRETRLKYEKGIADDKDPKRLYKHIRTKLSGPVKTIHVKDDSGLVVDSNNGVADVFAETFSKVFITEPPLAASTLSGNCNPNCITDIIFSRDTVLEKFKKLKTSKSSGPDFITANVLKNCAEPLSTPASDLMQQSFKSGCIPPDWKTAIVRPIFKKGDKFDASNYRPISLTSLVVKVMESVMYDQVIKFFSDHHLIPSEQHGFLPGKSVQSNLMCCMSEWTRSLDSERPFDVVYLDFSKAFDRVPKCRLLRKLSYLGIRGHLLRWIDSFLSDRTFRVRIGGALSRSVDVLSGVPQGSVLGPLLFIAYTADIKDILTSPFAMYADDIKLYNSCDNIQRLPQDLHTTHKWSLD
jgi:hypothetical protein